MNSVCPRCGQSAAPETRFCANCGAPMLPGGTPSLTSCGLAVLGAAVGTVGVLAFVIITLFAPGSRKPEEFDAWVHVTGLTLLILGLMGGVGLLPLFPGMVRGLGVGLIIGAALAAVLLGLLQSCAATKY